MSIIEQFLATVANFSQQFQALEDQQSVLLASQNKLVEGIQSQLVHNNLPNADHPLKQAGLTLDNAIANGITEWVEQWDLKKASRDVSNEFGDKILLFVFGKVNAGKSAFCDFIAQLFPSDQIQYFTIEEGKKSIVRNPQDHFKQGVIETTSQIKGVELAGKLVLLDSPGLFSVTEENGALTQRYIDSADGMLWLSPSTSPGQIDELEALKKELISNKPLVPLITRSDDSEEDEDESGNIIATLTNKAPERRALQEQDVLKRAKQSFDEINVELCQPISLSVHCYLQSAQRDDDLEQAGLSRLFGQLSELINKAANYKPRKARQQAINHLEQSVLCTLNEHIDPQISTFSNELKQASNKQAESRKQLEKKLNVELSKKVLSWAEEVKQSKDKQALSSLINQLITENIANELARLCDDFATGVKTQVLHVATDDIGDFTDVTVEIEQIKGRELQAGVSGGLGLGAAALGAALGGAVGATIGGLLGSWLGNKGGESLVQTEFITETVGVSTHQLVEDTCANLKKRLPEIIAQSFAPWEEVLHMLQTKHRKLEQCCSEFKQDLEQINKEYNDATT